MKANIETDWVSIQITKPEQLELTQNINISEYPELQVLQDSFLENGYILFFRAGIAKGTTAWWCMMVAKPGQIYFNFYLVREKLTDLIDAAINWLYESQRKT